MAKGQGHRSPIDPDETGLTAEQAAAEQKLVDAKNKQDTAPIGSEFEAAQRAALEEAEEANKRAEDAVADAALANQKAERAKARVQEIAYQEAMKHTYTLFAKENHRKALRLDDSKARVPIVFNQHTCILNPPFMDMLKRQFGITMTTHELVAVLKKESDYGIGFLVVAGPGVKLTPAQEGFRQSILKNIAREQQQLVSGVRSTGDTA